MVLALRHIDSVWCAAGRGCSAIRWNIQTVAQKQPRRSDARITLGVYAHVISDQQRDAESRASKSTRERSYGLPCGAVSTVRDFSILIHRAGRSSCGAAILYGPCFSPSGERVDAFHRKRRTTRLRHKFERSCNVLRKLPLHVASATLDLR